MTNINKFFVLPIVAICSIYSCSNFVTPDLTDTHQPDIMINGFAPGANGNIEKDNVTSTTVVNVDLGMDLMITGSANNPGGVRSFSIEISQGANILFSVNSVNPSSAKVPNPLAILGTDNSGGPGNNAMLIKMNEVTTVKATAENYNKTQKTIVVTYVPFDKSIRGVSKIETITLTKGFGQITYSATFPNMIGNGQVTTLQGHNYTLYLLLQGKTAADCSNSSSYKMLSAGGNLFPWDMQNIFGSPTPAFPIKITSCSNQSNIDQVDVIVYYKIN